MCRGKVGCAKVGYVCGSWEGVRIEVCREYPDQCACVCGNSQKLKLKLKNPNQGYVRN